jgi:hypothetical protein
MKTTKKQLKEIQEIENKVAEVCDDKKTIEVTRNKYNEIVEKQSGKQHFEQLLDELCQNQIEMEVLLTYDDFAPSLKKQLKDLGFKIPKGDLKDAEKIRFDLLALNRIKILSNKQTVKCFKNLNIMITKIIMDDAFDEEELKTMHIETKKIK